VDYPASQGRAAASLIREAVWEADRELPVEGVAELAKLLDESAREQRFRATLLMAFAITATALAALGLFGSTARMAGARRREWGIRLTLGARRRRLLLQVARAELGVLAFGLTLGLGGAYLAALQVRTFLFELTPVDPVTWIVSGSTLLLVGVAAIASAGGRAVRVDPVESMRAD
jgi:ABC-type antimicrobial peptide transport system permease subunit